METRNNPTNTVHMEAEQIYRKLSPQLTIDDFILSFSGKLSAENRWVQLADRIYRNRTNLSYCKARGIRLSGSKLGRPQTKSCMLKAERLVERQDAKNRNAIEGKFGEGKRKYGLRRIVAKLKETSESVIMLQFLVMNLEHKLRVLFAQIMFWIFGRRHKAILVG